MTTCTAKLRATPTGRVEIVPGDGDVSAYGPVEIAWYPDHLEITALGAGRATVTEGFRHRRDAVGNPPVHRTRPETRSRRRPTPGDSPPRAPFPASRAQLPAEADGARPRGPRPTRRDGRGHFRPRPVHHPPFRRSRSRTKARRPGLKNGGPRRAPAESAVELTRRPERGRCEQRSCRS
jgi:hypothetical protein